MNKEELESLLEDWCNVLYRMKHEGIEYCFIHYSDFNEIKDNNFHNMRTSLVDQMEAMREFVEKKIEELENKLSDYE